VSNAITPLGLSLTVSERRSLRGLGIPRSLLSQTQPAQRNHDVRPDSVDTSWRGIFHPLRSLFSDSTSNPLLEGKVVTRHWLNPKAIVAVGEFQSFCHVPGVGTHWHLGDRKATVIEYRCLFRQLWWLICEILQPTRARKQWNRRWRQFVLPQPPPPHALRRRTIARVQEKASASLLIMLRRAP